VRVRVGLRLRLRLRLRVRVRVGLKVRASLLVEDGAEELEPLRVRARLQQLLEVS